MNAGEKAKGYFYQGYNCAQSVALAFKEIVGMDEETLLRAVSAFGGGMGRLREVCGAMSGAFFVLGCVCGYSDPDDAGGKNLLYRHVQTVAERFKAANGTIICRELLGLRKASSAESEPRNEKYYATRPCPELVASAADILENYLAYLPMPLNGAPL